MSYFILILQVFQPLPHGMYFRFVVFVLKLKNLLWTSFQQYGLVGLYNLQALLVTILTDKLRQASPW